MSGSSVAFVVQACANFSSQQAYPAQEGIHLCHFHCLRHGAANLAATLVKHFGHVAQQCLPITMLQEQEDAETLLVPWPEADGFLGDRRVI